jgi:hypothetical protein
MRRDALSAAKSTWERKMRVVEPIERLALEKNLVHLRETECAAKQANANDAVALTQSSFAQYEIAIRNKTLRGAVLELDRHGVPSMRASRKYASVPSAIDNNEQT